MMTPDQSVFRVTPRHEAPADFIAYRPEYENIAYGQARLQLMRRGWACVGGLDTEAQARNFLGHFGRLLPQFNGELSYDVKAAADSASHHWSWSKSTHELTPHTEATVYDPPPRYLALYCVQPAACGGGHTIMADAYDMIEQIDHQLHHSLWNQPIDFSVEGNPTGEKKRNAEFPMLCLAQDNTPIVRFSYNVLWYGRFYPEAEKLSDKAYDPGDIDPFVRKICTICKQYVDFKHTKVLTPQGGLLIWDNFRTLHARTGFTDSKRHLIRYFLSDQRIQ